MSVKIQVDLKDKYRVLMTELLPYELPLWFSNECFYEKIRKSEDFIKDVTSGLNLKNYIPLDYKICKTGGGARMLSIMHPTVQKEFCDFYHKYQDLIIYYCGRSKRSLRFPVKTASSFFKKEVYDTSNQAGGIEDYDKDYSNFISFFKYDKFPFLYKFFESYDYNKLEKRFRSLVQVDVSKCFHSIYTHTISWAIKNKFVAKRDIKKGGFDQEFDSLMRRSNYNETNGILIGPEVSRIFAEIIFQDIDQKIICNLEEKKIRVGNEYDFRRYVDDYFVYFNDSNVRENVIEAINSELLHYKMHLNEAKTIISKRPFITNISICKLEISLLIEKMYTDRYSKDIKNKKLLFVGNTGKKSNQLITELKSIVKRYEVPYSSICNYCMSILYRKNVGFISTYKNSAIDDETERLLIPWLLIDIDLLYFIHAMDPRIVPTDKLVRLLLEMMKLKEIISSNNYELIEKKMFDASIEAIRIFNTSSPVIYPIETINLLLLLSKIKNEFKLEKTFIRKYFNLPNSEKENTKDAFYFLWCSLMLYIEDDMEYSEIRDDLISSATKYFKENIYKFESTEFLLFWGDFLACPYIDVREKRTVVRDGTKIKSNKGIDNYIEDNFGSHKGMIVDWDETDWLSKNIKKKVFKYAYE